MDNLSSWREILRQAIISSSERQRIAEQVGVDVATLNRWIKGEATPRRQSMQRLPEAIPRYREQLRAALEREFGTGAQAAAAQVESTRLEMSVPAAFYALVLRTKASIPEQLRFSSLCDLLLEQALKHLDPQRQGMELAVALCVTPAPGQPVRSLHVSFGRGTPPFRGRMAPVSYFVGAESLMGAAVSSRHLQVNQRLGEPSTISAGYATAYERSAVATPLMDVGKVAGCLCVSSTRPDAFSPELVNLIEQYGDLLAVLLASGEFYAPEHIALGVLPRIEDQQSVLAPYRPQFAALLKAVPSSSSYRLLHELEERLLQYLLKEHEVAMTEASIKKGRDHDDG